MKDNKNIKVNNVPSITTRCSLAETGWNDYDDFEHPLKPLDIIPEDEKDEVLHKNETVQKGYDGPYVDTKLELLSGFTKPSSVRSESLVTITVPDGIHPITLLKPEVINNAWIFLDEKVVENIKKFSYKFQQDTIAYGEFFRLENNDSFSLQKVEYFEGWRVLLNADISNEIFQRPEHPEFIIEMVMED